MEDLRTFGSSFFNVVKEGVLDLELDSTTKMRLFQTLVMSVLLYKAETSTSRT